MRFRLINADRLEPIHILDEDVRRALAEDTPRFDGGDEAEVSISTALQAGVHRIEVPAAMRELPELLVLAESTAPELPRRTDGPSSNVCLWVLRPADGTLEVVPQDWFNEADYDFDYVWITRVARDPETGQIVGDGIRLPSFALDASMRRVASWL